MHNRRVLLFGAPGVGKSTLVTELAKKLEQFNHTCWCISADPGSPLLGVPGAVALGHWEQEDWQVHHYAALCTLDAGRFRLPLVSAVRQLSCIPRDGVVLVDGPGVVRGVAGRELLEGLVEVTQVDTILVVTPTVSSPPLVQELRALDIEVMVVPAAIVAMRPGKKVRARRRTEQWDRYIEGGISQCIDLEKVNLIGIPPPREETYAWTGRQVALLRARRTLVMGEVQKLEGNLLTILLSATCREFDTILVRDAVRTVNGVIETAEPWVTERLDYMPPADVLPSIERNNGPRLAGRVGSVDVALINGVFGDPLLHIRLRHQRRSLLFDLGSGERLSARIAHQVTDVFITHAHLDHIGGFVWLMRSRIGEFPPCRLYGPPGLALHIAGFIQGVLWDRVALHGPRFEVMEFDGRMLQSYHLQATQPEPQLQDEREVEAGVLIRQTGFCVRAIVLDHQGTQVLAYALEPDRQINVRKDRLLVRGLEPGPWLTELKRQLLSGNETSDIHLPDGSDVPAATLAEELVLITPGKRLVYATDLADTPDNRQRLIAFASHAHTFFCEAPFIEKERDHAFRNGHLTTRACGEIAEQAGVARLVPMHLSRRYMADPQKVYDELVTIFPRVVIPGSTRLFQAASATLTEDTLELE
jgi:ribonuclease BN (tRNA processing enzyme)